MQLPFTAEQFFDLFGQYNEAVWPAQVVLNLLALGAIGLWIQGRPHSGRLISGLLAFLWAWTGIAYHWIYFTTINKAAYAFGLVFILGCAAFLWAGVIKGQLAFTSKNMIQRATGGVLVVFALFVYPALSVLFGHIYPAMPTFGLPCPTTIFTIGMLCFLAAPFPRYVLAAPVLWAAVGSQAAILLGVYQDLGLLIAGIVGVFLIGAAKRTCPNGVKRQVHPEPHGRGNEQGRAH
ncbi:MAG: hypothetical protein C4519_04605 [Desulfobacteraceae bacterium]|nr:MAG: hypothetical protein C4519_04605 [Desulfobacteraceae bacterium]